VAAAGVGQAGSQVGLHVGLPAIAAELRKGPGKKEKNKFNMLNIIKQLIIFLKQNAKWQKK
jgi:hypothetical protein